MRNVLAHDIVCSHAEDSQGTARSKHTETEYKEIGCIKNSQILITYLFSPRTDTKEYKRLHYVTEFWMVKYIIVSQKSKAIHKFKSPGLLWSLPI